MIFKILLLIGLTCCVSAGTFKVKAVQPVYEAEEEKAVTLEWTFPPQADGPPSALTVSCYLFKDPRHFLVYQYYKGSEIKKFQTGPFAGRVRCDTDALKDGRLRLHVSSLTAEDSGRYQCKVIAKDEWSMDECQLKVTGLSGAMHSDL